MEYREDGEVLAKIANIGDNVVISTYLELGDIF